MNSTKTLFTGCPTVCADPILVMGFVKGQLFYCYGSHYEMGLTHTVVLGHSTGNKFYVVTFIGQLCMLKSFDI